MLHNMSIWIASKRVALADCFYDVLKQFYREAKLFTRNLSQQLVSACYASDVRVKTIILTAK